jgi:hypothetical protein
LRITCIQNQLIRQGIRRIGNLALGFDRLNLGRSEDYVRISSVQRSSPLLLVFGSPRASPGNKSRRASIHTAIFSRTINANGIGGGGDVSNSAPDLSDPPPPGPRGWVTVVVSVQMPEPV